MGISLVLRRLIQSSFLADSARRIRLNTRRKNVNAITLSRFASEMTHIISVQCELSRAQEISDLSMRMLFHTSLRAE